MKNKLIDFDSNWLVRELTERGGAAFPLLPQKRCASLAHAARQCAYVKQPTAAGKYGVREELSSCTEFAEKIPFITLAEEITDFLNYKLSLAGDKPFDGKPALFNEISLQKYPKGSLGITPHRDHSCYTGLILVLIVQGRGDVFLCDDREKTNSYKLPMEEGTLTILRAPGYFGSSLRPFHYVTNITEERIVFGMRYNDKKIRRSLVPTPEIMKRTAHSANGEPYCAKDRKTVRFSQSAFPDSRT